MIFNELGMVISEGSYLEQELAPIVVVSGRFVKVWEKIRPMGDGGNC